jgi:hypothetical protein
MDEMQDWEIQDCLDNIPYLNFTEWETARLNAYVTAQVNNKKKLKFQDIAKFAWDSEVEEKETSDIEISNEDIERLKKKSELIKHKCINNGK